MTLGKMNLPVELLAWVRRTVPAGSAIVELGSGEGTKHLAKFYEVWSVEHDPAWLGKALTHYVHAPLLDGWYHPGAIFEHLPAVYSLLIVDGPPGNRSGLLKHLNLFRRDVPMVFDDLNQRSNRRVWMGVIKDRGVRGTVFRKTRTGKWWGVVPGAKP
jgi:hypothetical protein